MDVVGIIEDALRGLFGTLCEVIYPMIAKLYEIFIELGTLAHVEDLEVIYNKISLIIGIFMVFRLTFWLIESLVNPDNLKDKENNPGKIIQKVLISVVLLAITPTIFDYAFKLQSTILESGMIEKIISTNGTADAAKTGRLLSAELFVNFYTPNLVDGSVINDKSGCANFAGKTGIVYQNLKNNGEMKNLTNDCLTASEPMQINDVNTKVYVNDFNGLFATAVGIFVFWIILMYCISLGARYVQLIYLQVIAPIPIMCYLAPGKDNMFSKWLKQCTTTYLDVFIRVVIISFILVLCEILLNSNLFDTFSESGWVIKVFLILGLLTFAKKAPELIQELLPKSVTKASGDFGLSWKKRTDSMLGGKLIYSTVKRAPGYVAGGLAGSALAGTMGAMAGHGAGSKIMGALSGAAKGFKTGSKKGSVLKNLGEVKKNQAAQNRKLEQWRIDANKGEYEANTFDDWRSRKADAFRKSLGFETRAAEQKRDTEFANRAAGSYKSILDFGVGKALEKDKKLYAFGVNRGIAELSAIQKSAEAEYQEFTAEKLLTTDAGKLKLKNISRNIALQNIEEQKKNELMSSGIKEEDAIKQAKEYIEQNRDKIENIFEQEYQKEKTDAEKAREADAAVEYLRKTSINAGQIYDDYKKKAGFIHLVEEYAEGKDQNVINEFEVMNDFLATHPDIAQEYGKDSFDPTEMKALYDKARAGDKNAQAEFESLFKSFDRFKTLKSEYVRRNSTDEALRDKANETYNGK